jgi:hypothetical protein
MLAFEVDDADIQSDTVAYANDVPDANADCNTYAIRFTVSHDLSDAVCLIHRVTDHFRDSNADVDAVPVVESVPYAFANTVQLAFTD